MRDFALLLKAPEWLSGRASVCRKQARDATWIAENP